MIKKAALSLITLSLFCNITFAETSLETLLKDNATIYTYININKINKESSFLCLNQEHLYSNDLNKVKLNYDLINKSLVNSGGKKCLDDIFLAVKTKTSKNIFSVKKQYELAFAFKLNKSITYKELENILKLFLPSKDFKKINTQYIESENSKRKILIIKTALGNELAVTLLNNNKTIAGGNTHFIKILSDAGIEENKMSELEQNNDVVIEYTLPKEAKKELQSYAANLKNNKNALPIDISFLDSLKYIRTTINFSDIIKFNTTLYLNNKNAMNKAKELSNQLLPLLKFQLLTNSKGKKLTIVDTIQVNTNAKNMTMNITFDISKNDIKELNLTKNTENIEK
jgi:hypothetical protein